MDEVLAKTVKTLPANSGVYLFSNREGKIIYVGKAVNLKARLQTYLSGGLDPKSKIMVSKVANIQFIKVFSDFEAILLEAALIQKYKPKYNIRLKDDKSFLYIAITKEEFPKVLATRKNDISNPKYLFGPFPSAKTAREILRFLRKIFSYCSQKGNRQPCFWSHLGLCFPCPGAISKLTGEDREVNKKIYLKGIKNLVSVLSGKSKSLIKKLSEQMTEAADRQEFEKGAELRDQISKLEWLTEKRFSISSYLENSSFFDQEQERELKSLLEILGPLFSNLTSLRRIECYDVSNILGFYATGSMVVFENGVASQKDYRKFKIKISGRPNDVAMMKEILQRRLKHKEWDYPDLIIVDGGRSQVKGATDVLDQLGMDNPVVGLAKRLETLVIPSIKHREINLPNGSPALNLLMRIRDESHRFALAYHRKLRSMGLAVINKENHHKSSQEDKS